MADRAPDSNEGWKSSRTESEPGEELALRVQVRDFETRLGRIEEAVLPGPAGRQEPASPKDGLPGKSPEGPQVGGLFSLETIEREHIERVLARSSSLLEAARILGIDQSTLYRKRMRYVERDGRSWEAPAADREPPGSGRMKSGS
jgi:hypothetical protein